MQSRLATRILRLARFAGRRQGGKARWGTPMMRSNSVPRRRGFATSLPRKGWPVVMKADVQWGDQDAYHHINNTQYFRWWETSHIEYLRRFGMMLAGNATDPLGAIIARSECNFIKAVRYPDTVTVRCRGTTVGNSSIGVEYKLENGAGDTCATGAATLVLFDYIKNQKNIIDDELRNKILELEAGAAVEDA